MFSEYRLFWISPARSPDFISIRVYLHIQDYTSHTHRHTHVLSLCLSLVCMCVWSREGGGSLSRERNVWYDVWVGGRERGRRVWVYPGTPGIIVSNLSVTLHPNKKSLTRFEIAASQVYAADTVRKYAWNFWFLRRESDRERETRHWYQDFPCTWMESLSSSHYQTHSHTTQTPKENVCVCVCVCGI